jgi:long-subunit acyl-CoA synthetase (AMP-forming)
VLAALEDAFHAPVIEAHGMTEAAHQMASNALPPGVRKPGAAGLPAGPEIASPSGDFLPTAVVGEIGIRGPNVTTGYESNDSANTEAFRNGRFRTGD